MTASKAARILPFLALALIFSIASALAAGKGFYPDGKIKYEYLYQDGKVQEAKWYDQQGRLTSRALYEDERVVQTEGYTDTGSLEWQVKQLDEARQEVSRFAADQQLTARYQLVAGQADGEYSTFYPNGQPQQTVTYRQGILEGPAKSFYESGQLKTEFNYSGGQVDGLYRTFAPEGQVVSEQTFNQGQPE